MADRCLTKIIFIFRTNDKFKRKKKKFPDHILSCTYLIVLFYPTSVLISEFRTKENSK